MVRLLVPLASLLVIAAITPPANGAPPAPPDAFTTLLYSAAHVKCGRYTLVASYYKTFIVTRYRISIIKNGKVGLLGRLRITNERPESVELFLRLLCEDMSFDNLHGAATGAEVHQLGMFPLELQSGYFNADDTLDLAAVNQNSHNVSVLPGIPGGSGTAADPWYGSAVNYLAGQRPTVLRSGDFNGDSETDLLTANLGNFIAGGLNLLLGNGDGTFDPPSAVTQAGTTPRGDADIGLLDNDNHLDIAVPDGQNQRIMLLFGNGNGTFDPPVYRSTPGFPGRVRIVDFDQDDTLDLVTTESIALGNGDGTFAAPVSFEGALQPDAVAVDDMDGDDQPDVVVSSLGSNTLAVLRGTGGATVALHRRYAVGKTPERIEIDDLNRDGQPDVVVSSTGTDHFSVLWGEGGGVLRAAVVYPASTSPQAGTQGLALAQLNADSFPDLVAGNGSTEAARLPGGASGFGAPNGMPAQRGSAVVAGRFDADSLIDLAFAPGSGSNDVELRISTGNFGFAAAVGVALPENGATALGLWSLDLDNDQDLDLLTLNQTAGGFSLLRGNGAGAFVAGAAVPSGTRPLGLAAGRVDADLLPDVVVANAGDFGMQNGRVTVHRNNGAGGFLAPLDLLANTSPDAVAIADWNRDGKFDLAVSAEVQQFSWGIRVLLGDGLGGFGTPQPVAMPPDISFVSGVQAVDLNLDQNPDLLAHLAGDQVVLFEGRGDGTFKAGQTIDDGEGAAAVLVGLVDADRRPDLLSAVVAAPGGVTVHWNRSGQVFANGFATGDTTAWNSSSGQ